ncbi:hypothetical protein TIFTF001_056316 [Ficus carica]|uniref:Uncharacterized protein n=1 Tax=Ficus carica TaxID=3494 RepID=A0AA88EK86_FICCA|nr:hypothetical protein TIFTF001_056316 [Ficus carica]
MGSTRAVMGVAEATSAPSGSTTAVMGSTRAVMGGSHGCGRGHQRAQWLDHGSHGLDQGSPWRQSWAWPRPPARPVARPGQSWAWPRPPACPVPRARPRLAWPRPPAHARALAEAPCAHMGVAGRASGCLAAHDVDEMTFFTISF